jgi:hypothetical protein
MAADTDDDALSWKGDSDPSLVTTPAAKPAATSAEAPNAPKPDASKPDAAKPSASKPGEAAPKPTSSFLLVTYGILAGAYLIFAVGWIIPIVIERTHPKANLPIFTEIMTQTGEYFAIASGALWFAGVFLLTWRSKPIIRLLLLLAGLVLLIPWPFVLGGIQ